MEFEFKFNFLKEYKISTTGKLAIFIRKTQYEAEFYCCSALRYKI